MGIEAPVHGSHVKFIFEVGGGAKTPENHPSIGLSHIVDEEPFEAVNDDIGIILEEGPDDLSSFFRRKKWSLFGTVSHRNDDLVEDLKGPFNDIDMTIRDGIKRTWIDGYFFHEKFLSLHFWHVLLFSVCLDPNRFE